MKQIFKKAISVLLVLTTVFTTGILGSMISISAASNGFEAQNSYLTYEEYRSLNLNVGKAQPAVKNAAQKMESQIDGARLVEEVYGWSNPQILAVMASAPYWSELDYGGGLTSSGTTSFTVSSTHTTGSTNAMSIEAGISVTTSTDADIFGNGGKAGASVKKAVSFAQNYQENFSKSVSHRFTAGGGDDYVALMVFPVASFKYEYKTPSGKTQAYYVNIQLTPVFGMATLDTYNNIARNHNLTETASERMMPVIELDKLIKGYEPGDPSTYPQDVSQIPTNLSLICGDMHTDKYYVSAEDTSKNKLTGVVHTTGQYSSVGTADTRMDQTISFSESTGTTITNGVMLGGSVFGEVKGGIDLGFVSGEIAVRTDVFANVGISVSCTTIDTQGLEFSMSFANLPNSAKTGINSMGESTTPYGFNAELAVWVPDTKGKSVWTAPMFVLPIVSFDESKTLPPALPQEFFAESITDTTATLMFSTDLTKYSKRFADKYILMMSTKGNAENNYVPYAEFSPDLIKYEVTNLKPDTSYTFAIKSVASDGTKSALSIPLTFKTSASQSPVIEKQPKTMMVDEGDKPIFTVVPQGNIYNYYYQWEKMTENSCGYEWTPVSGADQNTFNVAYFSADGTVTGINRKNLEDTAYRCVVTDKSTGVNVVSDVAVLYISDAVLIDDYNELEQIAEKIASGDIDAGYRDYNLGADIVFPQGELWTIPFGTDKFPYRGEFDGKGHTIKNFTFNNPGCEFSGFFGCTQNAYISNITLENAKVTGGDYAGAFVGKTINTIVEKCFVTGDTTVKGNYAVGGFAGSTGVSSVFINCYAESILENFESKGFTGGFAGMNYGSDIENCLARCRVSAAGTNGGIAGINLCRIKDSFFDNSCFSGNAAGQSLQATETNTTGIDTNEFMLKLIEFNM